MLPPRYVVVLMSPFKWWQQFVGRRCRRRCPRPWGIFLARLGDLSLLPGLLAIRHKPEIPGGSLCGCIVPLFGSWESLDIPFITVILVIPGSSIHRLVPRRLAQPCSLLVPHQRHRKASTFSALIQTCDTFGPLAIASLAVGGAGVAVHSGKSQGIGSLSRLGS